MERFQQSHFFQNPTSSVLQVGRLEEALNEKGYRTAIIATGPALKKFDERKLKIDLSFNVEGLDEEDSIDLAKNIANHCKEAFCVITDAAHPFDPLLQEQLKRKNIVTLAGYDNPEPYVPGGYSEVAAKVMKLADGVLFSNANLSNEEIFEAPSQLIELPKEKRYGIGYYPLAQAEKLIHKRSSAYAANTKQQILEKFPGVNTVCVYFGGNNSVYFHEAFPAFLRIIEETSSDIDLSDMVILVQQHPGAAKENRDGLAMTALSKNPKMPKFGLSTLSTEDAQSIADVALYYQTSMGPLFALAGIPTMQIGHETFSDILVKNHLAPSVTTSEELINAIVDHKTGTYTINKALLYEKLGIRKNCKDLLEQAILNTKASAEKETSFSLSTKMLTAGALLTIGFIAFRYLRHKQ